MKHLRRWGSAPIIIPRWVLTTKYVLFCILGLTVGWAGLPSLDLTTWSGYVSVWALVVAASSAVAAVGSLRKRWEPLEKWAVIALVSVLSVYVASVIVLALSGDTSRAPGAVVVTIIMLVPAARAVELIARTGLPRD